MIPSINTRKFSKYLVLFILLTVSIRVSAVSDPPDIFPIPRQAEFTEEWFELDESVTILIPAETNDNEEFLADILTGELSERYRLAIFKKHVREIAVNEKIIIAGTVDNPLISQYCKENNIDPAREIKGPEGYFLHILPDKVIVGGIDLPGAFYGVQSLRQLLARGDGRRIRGGKIIDWPQFSFRAIRLYVPGPENIPFFERFLKDFMAYYKFNKVILEMGCMRLDNHPEINAGLLDMAEELKYARLNRNEGPRGEYKNSSHYDVGDGQIIEKWQVRELKNVAEQNFIEIIPEIPSLTHSYYLLARHPELAEYAKDRWPDTYCPSNPASYDLLFQVLDEYIEVLNPEMIHIGHDEWRIPTDVCLKCTGKDYSTLFAEDVQKIHSRLKSQNIQVAMWGDHLLESVRNSGPRAGTTSTGINYMKPGGMRKSTVSDSIPKDILVMNWFWDDPAKDREIDEFGFRQIYGNLKPNISGWPERTRETNILGGAPSSWAATSEFNFGKDLMLDFLGCANLLWSTHLLKAEDLVLSVREEVPYIRNRLAVGRVPSSVESCRVEPVELSGQFDVSGNSLLFGRTLANLKQGKFENRSFVFRSGAGDRTEENCALAVTTKIDPQIALKNESEPISINQDVSSLIFLHACARPAENQKAYYNIPDFFDTSDLLGWYEIVYEDQFTVTVPIQYGVNILEMEPDISHSIDLREGQTGSPQNAYCYSADPVNCSADGSKGDLTFFAFEWVNPRFGKKISSVKLIGTLDYQSAVPASNPETKPMPANAVILAAINKVVQK